MGHAEGFAPSLDVVFDAHSITSLLVIGSIIATFVANFNGFCDFQEYLLTIQGQGGMLNV